MSHEYDTPHDESLEEDTAAELGIEPLSVFLTWVSQAVLPHHDDGRTGHVDQFGEFGLRVPATVPPIFEPLRAGRPCLDAGVSDWSVFSVGCNGVEEACIDVLVYEGFFAFDGDGEWFFCHGSLVPFVRCCGGEEFLHAFPAFFGECPSPAWSFPDACSVPVDAVGVSGSFEFDHAASQALRRVEVAERRRY